MLSIYLKGVRLAADATVESLATQTRGFSGADLQLACRDASMMPMRRACEGKTPQEIVELHAEGALEGEVSAADFKLALQHTQPSVTSEETAAYAAWNKEHGCMADGSSGPNLATPSRTPSRPSPASAGARTRFAPISIDDEQEAEIVEVVT